MPDYSAIENPYDSFMQRSENVGLDVLPTVGSATLNSAEQEPASINGNTFKNLWIRTWIKSQNYAPKSRGFMIDGEKGYIEASDIYLTGSIVAVGGSAIGGFETGADYIRDSANSFGLASTVTASNDVRFWAGDTFANRTTAPFRVYESGTVVANDIFIVGGVIDSTSSIGGRTASVLATAIDASGHFADDAINTASSTILNAFTFGASGALQIGTYVNGVTGDIRISPTGILGRDSSGATTFSINGTTGVAVLNGLVVGTNVGLGTAQDSAGVTTIIGSTVTTGFVNALNVNAATVSASISITSPTITGGSISIGSGNAIFKANSSGISLGHATFGSAPFRVDMAGSLVATSATITGVLSASDGSQIDNVYVTSPHTAAETIAVNDWVYLIRSYTHTAVEASEATYVNQGLPDEAYDTATGMNVSPALGGVVGEYRSYIQFDITSLPAELDRAILRLYCTGLGAAIEVNVKQVTEEWHEQVGGVGLTWNTKPTQNDNVRYDAVEITGTSAYFDFDITELYKLWKSGNNYGLSLNINAVGNYATFATEDHATAAYRPRLIIVSNSGNNVGKIGIAQATSPYTDISARVTTPGLKSETTLGVALSAGNLDDTIRVLKVGKYTDTGAFEAGRYYYLDSTAGDLSSSFSGVYNNLKVAYGISANEAEIKIGEHYRALTAKRWADDFKVAGSGSERGIVSDVHAVGGGWGTTANSGMQRIYVGFKPRKIKIQAWDSNTKTISEIMSIGTLSLGGVATQETQANAAVTGGANGTIVSTHNLATGTGGFVGALSSVDDIGFYIDWTAAGTTASTFVSMVIECWG